MGEGWSFLQLYLRAGKYEDIRDFICVTWSGDSSFVKSPGCGTRMHSSVAWHVWQTEFGPQHHIDLV